MKSLTEILKDGELTPFNFNGDTKLIPERSLEFIKTITDKNDLLKSVKIIRTGKLSKDLNVHYLDNTLYRVLEGDGTPTYANLENKPVHLNNLRVDLDIGILASTLEDNRENPNFEKETFDEFATNFSNGLANLAINGTSEDPNVPPLAGKADFLKLNKGYLQILKDSDEAIKVASNTKVLTSLKAVAGSIPSEVFGESVILANPMDLAALQAEVGDKNGGLAILLNGGAKSILGVPVMPVSYIPQGTYIATPLKNLIFSYGSDIAVKRWYENTAEVLRYRFTLYCDFAVAVPRWCVISSGENNTGGGNVVTGNNSGAIGD